MNLEEVDIVTLSRLTSQQIYYITCIECCKHYIAPATAPCGHTLCHGCWRGRKSCPVCRAPVERGQIKLNQPVQKLTEHVQSLVKAIEKLLNIKLAEYVLDSGETESENDPTKIVKDWLASSQNNFSTPAKISDLSSQEFKQNSKQFEKSLSKTQVYLTTRKTENSERVAPVSTPQDDWDRIETMEETEVVNKNKENIKGPMDIEPFYIDDNEYTTNNPRRSLRKRLLTDKDANFSTNNSVLVKEIPKDAHGEIDKKSNKIKQNWNNVKKMRKEFSKLNKINKSKLNVSIEMCKKTQSTVKPSVVLQNTKTHWAYKIDENTPNLALNDLPDAEMGKVASSNNIDSDEINIKETEKIRIPFYKTSALHTSDVFLPSDQVQKEINPIKTVNHNIESNEDIEITIKVGNTITNIVIKKKNDVRLKVNTDKEVQTSWGLQDAAKISSPQELDTRSISINIDSNNDATIEHKQITELEKVNINKPMTLETVKQVSSVKSAKKNTASADTGSGHFEITESVEKELSSIMAYKEIEEQLKTKSIPNPENISQNVATARPQSSLENTSQIKNTLKPQLDPENTSQRKSQKALATNSQKIPVDQEDLEYLNDFDIFESDNVKEINVELLKYAKNTTPSEILISTTHSRNKTQKTKEKRGVDVNDENLPTSKKQKLNNNDTRDENPTADLSKQSKHIQPDSESMNYDSIMGQVFASIDADMEEIKSQNVESQKFPNNNNGSITKDQPAQNYKTQNAVEGTQGYVEEEDVIVATSAPKIAEVTPIEPQPNIEDSNDFCVVEEEDVIEATSALKTDQVPIIEPQPNIQDFLTPVMSRNHESENTPLVENQVVEIDNDDSESVVEATPQKVTTFGNIIQKSIGASKEPDLSRITESKLPSENSQSGSTKIVVNLPAASAELKSDHDVTITNADAIKTSDTPLNINKFVNHIQHNSTPLNFDSDYSDPEQTICATDDAVAKTTQEKEFMRKAFERTPCTQVVNSLSFVNKRFCIAGSCLSANETAKLKALCYRYKWSYVDKYTRDLTHLVVGVDEENKAQRSVKFMCALAASKWIVNFEWVNMCLKTKNVVGEEKYEALDGSTGEPSPRRSRVASKKLLQGITFYCMGPFTVLSMDNLKEILEASGGRVVSEVVHVRVAETNSAPALLLAEPEHTQEDRFIYLALQLSIVPVNYEWVLNCLGSYSIGSIQELLLCPSSLLPKATAKWPPELLAREDD